MAISFTNLTASGDLDSKTSYVTASVTPAANTVVIVSYAAHAGSVPSEPTISGCDLTWTKIQSVSQATSNDDLRLVAWYGTGTPTEGAITFGSAGSPSAVRWTVVQVNGADTANPIVQSAKNSNSTSSALTVTLSDFSSENNATFGCFAAIDQDQTAVQTPEAGYTGYGGGWARRVYNMVEYLVGNDTSVSAGTTNTSADGHGGIAMELKISGGTSNFFLMF